MAMQKKDSNNIRLNAPAQTRRDWTKAGQTIADVFDLYMSGTDQARPEKTARSPEQNQPRLNQN